jgi:hypothetical protein
MCVCVCVCVCVCACVGGWLEMMDAGVGCVVLVVLVVLCCVKEGSNWLVSFHQVLSDLLAILLSSLARLHVNQPVAMAKWPPRCQLFLRVGKSNVLPVSLHLHAAKYVHVSASTVSVILTCRCAQSIQ